MCSALHGEGGNAAHLPRNAMCSTGAMHHTLSLASLLVFLAVGVPATLGAQAPSAPRTDDALSYATTSEATTHEDTTHEDEDETEREGRVRVDVNPFAPGFVHQVTEREDRLGLRMQFGLRAVFDGVHGAYLDGGLDWFFSGGTGGGWSSSTFGLVSYSVVNIAVSGTLEAGYLHRFVLNGTGRDGLAIDLGVGLTGAWIGAQISPGLNALASIDHRGGAFVIGAEVRGRAVAWFANPGVAQPLLEYQAVVRLGFGFGG